LTGKGGRITNSNILRTVRSHCCCGWNVRTTELILV